MNLIGDRDGLLTRRSLTHGLESGRGIDHVTRDAPKDGLVVDRQYPNVALAQCPSLTGWDIASTDRVSTAIGSAGRAEGGTHAVERGCLHG